MDYVKPINLNQRIFHYFLSSITFCYFRNNIFQSSVFMMVYSGNDIINSLAE